MAGNHFGEIERNIAAVHARRQSLERLRDALETEDDTLSLPKEQHVLLAVTYLELGTLYEALPPDKEVMREQYRDLAAAFAEHYYERALVEMRDVLDVHCSPNVIGQYLDLIKWLGVEVSPEDQAKIDAFNAGKEQKKPGFLDGLFGRNKLEPDVIGERFVYDVLRDTGELKEKIALERRVREFSLSPANTGRVIAEAFYDAVMLAATERNAYGTAIELERGYDPTKWGVDELGQRVYQDGTEQEVVLVDAGKTLDQVFAEQRQQAGALAELERRIEREPDPRKREDLGIMLALTKIKLEQEQRRSPTAVKEKLTGAYGTSEDRMAWYFKLFMAVGLQGKHINPALDQQRMRQGTAFDAGQAWTYLTEQFPAFESIARNIGALTELMEQLPPDQAQRAVYQLVERTTGLDASGDAVREGVNQAFSVLGHGLDRLRLLLR